MDMLAPLTVIRVKRKWSDESVHALVLDAGHDKRRKREAQQGNERQVFRLAQTISCDTPANDEYLRKLVTEYHHPPGTPSSPEKQPAKTGQIQADPRKHVYVVSPASASTGDAASKDAVRILDAQRQLGEPRQQREHGTTPIYPPGYMSTSDFLPMMQNLRVSPGPGKEAEGFVYDIYIRDDRPTGSDDHPSMAASLIFPTPDLVDETSDSEEDGDPDDVDSNAEDYYQNEYPDEDEWNFDDEENDQNESDDDL